MFKLGTNYGGWIIPKNNELNDKSIIYSIGVGEDISFDLLLQKLGQSAASDRFAAEWRR